MTNVVTLRKLASARSGDKGNHANVAVVARNEQAFTLLQDRLDAAAVQTHFDAFQPSSVQRFVLPQLHAMNFMLYDVLDGGASRSLRLDTQGKLFGTLMEELEIVVSDEEANGCLS